MKRVILSRQAVDTKRLMKLIKRSAEEELQRANWLSVEDAVDFSLVINTIYPEDYAYLCSEYCMYELKQFFAEHRKEIASAVARDLGITKSERGN